MAIQVSYWQRRDGADRSALGQAAFDLCRALRGESAVEGSRFYWAGPDTVVVQTEAKDMDALVQPLAGETAARFFALADVANQTRYEQWIDPRTGQMSYEQAGR
jgi:hypothetical protein